MDIDTTCRLLPGNVRNRELTIIQRRILRRLRNKKRSIKRKIYSRQNLNKMHRRAERTSYIPFPLNLETRSNVILIHLHFRETIPQARQLISHRRVCVNNGMVSIIRLKGGRNKEIFLYQLSISQIIGKFMPALVWRRTKTKWFCLLKTKRGCCLLLKSQFLQQLRLHSSIQEEDFERRKFGSEKVYLGSSFAEHNRMKRNLNTIVNNGHFYINSTYCSGSPHQFDRKRRITKIKLPTHYSKVNHRTPKVVFYEPVICHIPHDIRLKDPNIPLRSRNRRGQNN
ncbi:unnamed protein product [Victoria cruziana]